MQLGRPGRWATPRACRRGRGAARSRRRPSPPGPPRCGGTGHRRGTTPRAAELVAERGDDLGASSEGVPAGEVDHGAVVADGDQVAAVGDLVGRQPQPERRGLDRRPAGVVAGRVVAEDRHVADVAARRQPRRDHRGPPDLAPGGQGVERGHGATSSGVRPPSSARARRRSRRGRTPRTSRWPIMPRTAPGRASASVCRPIRTSGDPGGQRAGAVAATWASTAARSLGSTSKRSGARTGRRGGRAARGARWPRSTASGNFAGWAVARVTMGTSGSRRQRRGRGEPTAVCGSTSSPVGVHRGDDPTVSSSSTRAPSQCSAARQTGRVDVTCPRRGSGHELGDRLPSRPYSSNSSRSRLLDTWMSMLGERGCTSVHRTWCRSRRTG
jgi:hypothetical protein